MHKFSRGGRSLKDNSRGEYASYILTGNATSSWPLLQQGAVAAIWSRLESPDRVRAGHGKTAKR